uniref:Uncharacterized protein n=1 Tax=Rhizophora mucronata TaxID=61149 RepID=A0A2P2IL09_RHIMU
MSPKREEYDTFIRP